MRRNLHTRALVDLEQEASQSMAVVAQTVRLPDDRKTHHPGDQAQPIYELLRPIWVEKRETANRVRGRIETIIAKNVDVDDSDFRNPAELTKQLREKLPRRPKRVVRHHPALPYAEAPQFMADLSAAGGIAASMLRFLIFTACRTNEVVDARWSEIDRPSSTWKIPGERMKMHQDHVVPLSGACTRNPGQDARCRPGRIDLPEP